MKISIATKEMKRLVKMVSGLEKFNSFPITTVVGFRAKNGVLSLITTDTNNFVRAFTTEYTGDDMDFCLKFDQFSTIVSKTTSNDITIEFNETAIVFRGNGKYTIPLVENPSTDEYQKFPIYDAGFDYTPSGSFSTNTVSSILTYNKSSLETKATHSAFSMYRCGGGKVVSVSADGVKVCINEIDTFDDVHLIDPVAFDILGRSAEGNVEYYIDPNNQNRIKFVTPDVEVVSVVTYGLEEYTERLTDSKIDSLKNIPIEHSCSVKKSDILGALSRISVFRSHSDKPIATLSFNDNGITVSGSYAEETVPYVEVSNHEAFETKINTEFFAQQISANAHDTVSIYYGHPMLIQFKMGNVTQSIAIIKTKE